MNLKISAIERYNVSITKSQRKKYEPLEKKMKVLLGTFERSGKIRQDDDSIMQQIFQFALSNKVYEGAHDMIAKLHNLADVQIGRVVVQWCPGNDTATVVQCACRNVRPNRWNPLLRLVVIVPKQNSFAPGNVLYDRSNLCFLNL